MPRQPHVPVYETDAYNRDIQRGKNTENEILEGLKTSCGWTLLTSATAIQDMKHAIDAFAIIDGKKIPVQIKARRRHSTASDIGYEIAKDYQSNNPDRPPASKTLLSKLNGRDMRGDAELTILLHKDGNQLFVINTSEGYRLIREAVADWMKTLDNRADSYVNKRFRGDGIDLIRKFDERDHYWKIIAYIKPSKFKTLEICDLDYDIDTYTNFHT